MNTNAKDRNAVVALNLIPGLGPRAFKNILDGFKDVRDVFDADQSALAGCGLNRQVISRLQMSDADALAEEEKRKACSCGARLVTYFDEDYPVMLRHIYDPPIVLYQKGNLDLSRCVSVAVVGSRRASHYGLAMAEEIGWSLSSAGFNVVSGMARGIDTAAHKGAMAAGGKTTAVFGTGLDVVYPPENRNLMEKIMRCGTCVSEFPMSTRADRLTFPRRNRIISGLSLATIVVEAGAKSGALITADYAVEQGREVFAVPGQVDRGQNAGCHKLIKDGAHLYEKIEDLQEELSPYLKSHPRKKRDDADEKDYQDLSGEESAILALLKQGEPLFLDEIITQTGLPAERVAAMMLSLELKEYVRQFPGKRYALTPGDFKWKADC